jgi:hypothetical protein
MNLIDSIMGQLSGDNIDRLSSQLGASPRATQAAVEAAVPTMISSLAGMAANQDKLNQLSSTLSSLDLGKISTLGGLFSDPGAAVQKGGNLLSALFGEGLISNIVSAVSRYAGLDFAAAKKLLSFVMPFVLGKVAAAWQSKGGTPNSLHRLLADQSENIAAAVPSGFSLADIPGLPTAEKVVQTIGRTADAAVDTAKGTARYAVGAAENATRSIASWLVPIAVVLLAGLGLWYFLSRARDAKDVADNAADSAGDTVRAMRPTLPEVPDVPSVDSLTKLLTGTLTSATKVLSDITSADTAAAALPKLKDLGSQIDGIREQLSKLPSTAQTAVGELVSEKIGPIQDQVARIVSLPNVSEEVKTALQTLIRSLTDLNRG